MSDGVVLDASAVLAVAHREQGADRVAPLVDGACLSTVNWSEVARVCVTLGRDSATLREILTDAGCKIVPFEVDDAERAASLWPATREAGLSLGDRACLALAQRLGRPAVTADRAWVGLDVAVEVVCVR